jgi:biotin carboxyl carrier protein
MVEVTSQMVASVTAVLVSAGQAVSAGDTLLVVESMKMEIPVLAPVDGRVSAISVEVADIVSEGDVLAVIDPASR